MINAATAYLKEKGFVEPEIGVVLGTGLGGFANEVETKIEINYDDIPYFCSATMEFHKGKLVYGEIGGKKVLVMQGRFHFYEGHSMKEITFPIRVMKLLGIKNLLISNVSGGINPDYGKGELIIIDDHINLQSENPLTGINHDELGPRFPDMSQPYSNELNKIITDQGSELGMTLKKGVYASVIGPNLETRAEYRMLKIIGADLVGMSTVPEVIVAKHMDLPCAAVSVVTDFCDPDNLQPVNIEEIVAIAGTAEIKLIDLFKGVIAKIGNN